MKKRDETEAKPQARRRRLEQLVRFLCDSHMSKKDAETVRKFCGKYGECGEIERVSRKYFFTFRQYRSAPQTTVAWLIMLLPLDVVRKSNTSDETRRK